MSRWPNAVLQFEDFNMAHAQPLLERYRDHHLVFNDDIQVRGDTHHNPCWVIHELLLHAFWWTERPSARLPGSLLYGVTMSRCRDDTRGLAMRSGQNTIDDYTFAILAQLCCPHPHARTTAANLFEAFLEL